MPVKKPIPAQPILVLSPYTGRYLDVEPLLAFLDDNGVTRPAGDPGNLADMLQDAQDFVSVHTRSPEWVDAGRVLDQMSVVMSTLVELRQVFASMKQIG